MSEDASFAEDGQLEQVGSGDEDLEVAQVFVPHLGVSLVVDLDLHVAGAR